MSLLKRSGFLIVVSLCALVVLGAAPQDQKENVKKISVAQKSDNGKGDPANGKEVFQKNCDICHNADSTEDKIGPGLKGISHKAAHKLSDGTEHKDHSPAVLRKQVMEGSSMMPPVGSGLTPKEVDDVLAYLLSL